MTVKLFVRLVGITTVSILVNASLLLVLFFILPEISQSIPYYLSALNSTLSFWGIVFSCVALVNWQIVKKIRSQTSTALSIRLKVAAWLLGVVVIAAAVILLPLYLATLAPHRSAGVGAVIQQNISNMRAQGELYYNQNEYSYSGVCSHASIKTLLTSVEKLGGAVSCYANDQYWAVESTLVDREEYVCFDTESHQQKFFATSSISATDTACGAEVSRMSSPEFRYPTLTFPDPELREVTGQEKKEVLQAAGKSFAKNFRGMGDLDQESVAYTYSTSTGSYNFDELDLFVSGGWLVLNDEPGEFVYVHHDGRVFVK